MGVINEFLTFMIKIRQPQILPISQKNSTFTNELDMQQNHQSA
jgi:hypothetical protein